MASLADLNADIAAMASTRSALTNVLGPVDWPAMRDALHGIGMSVIASNITAVIVPISGAVFFDALPSVSNRIAMLAAEIGAAVPISNALLRASVDLKGIAQDVAVLTNMLSTLQDLDWLQPPWPIALPTQELALASAAWSATTSRVDAVALRVPTLASAITTRGETIHALRVAAEANRELLQRLGVAP